MSHNNNLYIGINLFNFLDFNIQTNNIIIIIIKKHIIRIVYIIIRYYCIGIIIINFPDGYIIAGQFVYWSLIKFTIFTNHHLYILFTVTIKSIIEKLFTVIGIIKFQKKLIGIKLSINSNYYYY